MKVEQLMIRDVKTCGPDDSLNVAAKLMWDFDCGCVPVVGADEKLVGMITDRDICMAAYTQGKPLDAMRVSSAMSHAAHACRFGDSILLAERLLREHAIRRIPIVDAEGRILGILSTNDLAREAARPHDPEERDVSAEAFTETIAAVCTPRRARAMRAAA